MKKFLLLTVILGLLAACSNTDKETSLTPEEPTKIEENTSDSEKADSNETVEASETTQEEDSTDENVDAESTDTNVEGETEDSPLKIQYLSELEAIEKEIESNPKGETQLEMNEIAAANYKVWDDALNKIWKELEKQLPTEEMDELREEQRRWIKDKYKAASEEAEQYKGGTMEPLVKTSTLAQVTKERCYELVEKYM
ncbi:lysozyme inhibitor LprI family protein [Fredinandcohnia onubensis]|uniref:lysozyme inhibitor LprI family protein n=1 Tax=Fredinandcohnia onubensis TaxID=1571209 RepID=UPI000C0BF19F|nr:lysozyme inhibitor LprI family protein [Fredinandcohnia onubensis]